DDEGGHPEHPDTGGDMHSCEDSASAPGCVNYSLEWGASARSRGADRTRGAGRVRGADQACAERSLRSRKRWILPDGVLGNSRTKWTLRGKAWAPNSVLTHFCSSDSFSPPPSTPSRRTTYASRTSPARSSGTPMTADSRTSG